MTKNTQTSPASPNPDVGRRIDDILDGVAPQPQPQAGKLPTTKTPGSKLVPDIAGIAENAGVVRQFKYWVGITASCPVNGIDLAGINFPKTNEQILPDPSRTGRKKRRIVAGSIVFLTEDKIRLMEERLPRLVIRFSDERDVIDEPASGENIGDVAHRPPRARIITIPTAEEIAERRRKGKHVRSYVPDPRRDVPAARFMFAQLCADQEHPSQGEFYPDPLEVTGLEWPEKDPGRAERLLQ